jgi:hypothetical protein
MDFKHGIKYAFLDFSSHTSVMKLLEKVPDAVYFGVKLQIRARYEKISTPYFDHSKPDGLDYKTIQLTNCPHNINKVFYLIQNELEIIFLSVGEIRRIKIFQRAIEKRATAFVTFKNAETAKKAAQYIKQQPAGVFTDSAEAALVDYPADEQQAVLRQHVNVVPSDAIWDDSKPNETEVTMGTLSKKARKIAAAENRIVYVRQLEVSEQELSEEMEKIGQVKTIQIIEKEQRTAFVVFHAASSAAQAVQQKTCGSTLPRHKRIDMPIHAEANLVRQYFEGIAEIKQIEVSESKVMVEFITAVGAAKGIVHCRTREFQGDLILADYSPSVRSETYDELMKSISEIKVTV